MLTANKISLRTDEDVIFANISVTFLPTSITYLMGLNGSGKTSLLRILANIQKPTSGEVLFSKKQHDISLSFKPYCLYIGHQSAIKGELTVLENVKHWAKLYDSYEAVEAALHFFNLQGIADKKCYELSAGNKQKVALSRLLACNANLWLLDEIDQNLDKNNQDLLDKLIMAKADSGGVIIQTTHHTPRIKSAAILNMHDYEEDYEEEDYEQ